MNSLPIPLLLAVKDRIFILRPHLLLPRHLRLPSLHLLQTTPLFFERGIDDCDDVVDAAEAFALTRFLMWGEAEGYFPGMDGRVSMMGGGRERGTLYHRRPPDRGDVALKGPNIEGELLIDLEVS